MVDDYTTFVIQYKYLKKYGDVIWKINPDYQ